MFKQLLKTSKCYTNASETALGRIRRFSSTSQNRKAKDGIANRCIRTANTSAVSRCTCADDIMTGHGCTVPEGNCQSGVCERAWCSPVVPRTARQRENVKH